VADEQDLEAVAEPRLDQRTIRLVELAWTLWHEPAVSAPVGGEPDDETTRIRSVVTAIRAARR
jgi:hypothetical protein